MHKWKTKKNQKRKHLSVCWMSTYDPLSISESTQWNEIIPRCIQMVWSVYIEFVNYWNNAELCSNSSSNTFPKAISFLNVRACVCVSVCVWIVNREALEALMVQKKNNQTHTQKKRERKKWIHIHNALENDNGKAMKWREEKNKQANTLQQ